MVQLRVQVRQDADETIDYDEYSDEVKLLIDKHIAGVEVKEPDGVYQVDSVSNVSVANTTIGIATVGSGTTIVRRIFARISGISTITGYSGVGIDTTSNIFGNFSWGRIELLTRTKENSYNFYGTNGVGGISTSGVVKRTIPLRSKNYNIT